MGAALYPLALKSLVLSQRIWVEIGTPCVVPFPPIPPGGSFLGLPAAVGNVAVVAVGMVGAAGLRRE